MAFGRANSAGKVAARARSSVNCPPKPARTIAAAAVAAWEAGTRVRALRKSTKSRGTTCFGKGWSLSSRKASNCRRALATGDLSPSKGGGSGVTSGSHSQMHSFTHPRGSRAEVGGMSVNRSGNDESDHLRHKRGNRSPRDRCGTSTPFNTDVPADSTPQCNRINSKIRNRKLFAVLIR